MTTNFCFVRYEIESKTLEKRVSMCQSCPFLIKKNGYGCTHNRDVRGIFEEPYGAIPVATDCNLVYVNWRKE